MKYQALCLVESKIVKELVNEGSAAALGYVKKINSIDTKLDPKEKYQLHQKAFDEFMETYQNKEDGRKIIGSTTHEELLKIYNETKAIFTNLAKNMHSKENYSLVSEIGEVKSDNPKLASIGKYSFVQWMGDVWREIKKPIIAIMDAISNMIAPEEKNKSTDIQIAQNMLPSKTSSVEKKGESKSTEIQLADNHSLALVEEHPLGELMPRNNEEAMKMWGPPPKPPISNKIKKEVDKVSTNEILGDKTDALHKERSGNASPKSVTMAVR